MLAFPELIAAKRDGEKHAQADIERIVSDFTGGVVPDYQMSAWLMAVVLKGMDAEETVWLTDAMARSGKMLDLSHIAGVKTDKHSTGGVADTTTLIVAPVVAACGVAVAKMSGRGLGHTGGTLDKLESIPGFDVNLTSDRFVEQVARVGVAVMAQSPEIDPADKKIYALRDVTGTVPSVPLIVSSILSKKIAGGADAIVLDVKVGSGALLRTARQAEGLAHELTRVATALGKRVSVVITDMNQPLGLAVGNSLEVIEAVEVLSGGGPAELVAVSVELAGRMLVMAGAAHDVADGRTRAAGVIADGSGLEKMREWIGAQGGDAGIVDDVGRMPVAPLQRVVRAPQSGYVQSFDATLIGRAAMALGAGRETTDATIDPGAGLVMAVRIGDAVEVGQELCTLYSASEQRLDAGAERFAEAVSYSPDTPAQPLLIHGDKA